MNEKQDLRLDYFRSRADRERFRWFSENDYLPPIYAGLSDEEFQLLTEWFEATEQAELIGETTIPLMSALLGLVGGNGIAGIVQCGHYAGYSTLMLGWTLRAMGLRHALFSMDILEEATRFTEEWVIRAGLQNQVCLRVGSSDDPEMVLRAIMSLRNPIQLVFIDSSHQYEHTLRELELWYQALQVGGLIVLHDVSHVAQVFDTTGLGGVRRALEEWAMIRQPEMMAINGRTVYRDGLGLGIIQKRLA